MVLQVLPTLKNHVNTKQWDLPGSASHWWFNCLGMLSLELRGADWRARWLLGNLTASWKGNTYLTYSDVSYSTSATFKMVHKLGDPLTAYMYTYKLIWITHHISPLWTEQQSSKMSMWLKTWDIPFQLVTRKTSTYSIPLHDSTLIYGTYILWV